MLTHIKHLLEMIRFSHTLFALPFALLAATMAIVSLSNPPPLSIQRPAAERGVLLPLWKPRFRASTSSVLTGIALCMVSARAAAMAFNRIADRKIDAANPRTRTRHIPMRVLTVWQVWAFFAACCIGFIAATKLFFPNRLPFYLSIPVLLFLCSYSYAKRFTALAHFWLGAALMLAPVCAWIAIRGEDVVNDPLDLLPAMILGGAVMLWVAGFDIIYACQDVDFDKQAGLHSVPATIGVKNALRLAAVCHLGMIVLLAVLPWFYPLFGWVYGSGIAAVAGLLIYEHSLVRADDLTRVNVAFFNVNAVVSIGLFAIGALDLLT